MLNTSEMYQRF